MNHQDTGFIYGSALNEGLAALADHVDVNVDVVVDVVDRDPSSTFTSTSTTTFTSTMGSSQTLQALRSLGAPWCLGVLVACL